MLGTAVGSPYTFGKMIVMNRILIFLIAMLFVTTLVTNAFGVDKKEKKETPSAHNKSDSTANKKVSSGSDSQNKKYDDFVDANKNGKDDRYENRKPKSGKSIPTRLIPEKSPAKKVVPAVPKKVEKKTDSSAAKPK